jgi:hypothetical protein
MAKSSQKVEGVNVRGKINQRSDVESTDQSVKDGGARSVRQNITSQQSSLQLGKYRASGLWAVVGLVIIALSYFAYRYLTPT